MYRPVFLMGVVKKEKLYIVKTPCKGKRKCEYFVDGIPLALNENVNVEM